MSDLFSYADLGNAIIVNQVAYHKTGVVNQPQTPDPAPTISNINGITFDRDDDNVLSGTMHRTWTACEFAVCLLNNNTFKAIQMGGTGTFTATSDGVIRIYSSDNETGTIGIIKNGISSGTIALASNPNQTNIPVIGANCFRVLSGDVITFNIMGKLFYGNFLPYIY